MTNTTRFATVLLSLGIAAGACTEPGTRTADPSSTPGSAGNPAAIVAGVTYTPNIDPADFTTVVDNPYFPLVPGTKWVYEGETEDGLERVEVEVTDDTKTVKMGVETVVVRDTVTIDGDTVEDTLDWFAQDTDGNVWYFGENTYEYENGKRVSDKGAWEAGLDGAQPGIIMPAAPAIGETYRQEHYKGEAEDTGEVIKLGESVKTKAGSFDDVLITEDINPLEPDVVEGCRVGLREEGQRQRRTDRAGEVHPGNLGIRPISVPATAVADRALLAFDANGCPGCVQPVSATSSASFSFGVRQFNDSRGRPLRLSADLGPLGWRSASGVRDGRGRALASQRSWESSDYRSSSGLPYGAGVVCCPDSVSRFRIDETCIHVHRVTLHMCPLLARTRARLGRDTPSHTLFATRIMNVRCRSLPIRSGRFVAL